MNGLEELKRLAYENACCRCQYYGKKGCSLCVSNDQESCIWIEIENELKAFHILVHSLAEDLKKDIVNDTDTDWSKEYDNSHDYYKNLMSKEDFLLVVKVLKGIFKK